MENYKRSRSLLEENRAVLVKMAEELLVHEVLDGAQVRRLVAGMALDDPEETPGASGKPLSSEEATKEQQSVVPPLPPLNKTLPQE